MAQAVGPSLLVQLNQRLDLLAERSIKWIFDPENELNRDAGRICGVAFVALVSTVILFISVIGIPLLVKCIQEYNRQVAAFRQKVADLERSVTTLTNDKKNLTEEKAALQAKIDRIIALKNAEKGAFRSQVLTILGSEVPARPTMAQRAASIFRINGKNGNGSS